MYNRIMTKTIKVLIIDKFEFNMTTVLALYKFNFYLFAAMKFNFKIFEYMYVY